MGPPGGLLAADAPEEVDAEEAILTSGQLHHQPQGDPVGAEPEGLVLLGGEDGIEEDAPEGDLGPALVAEGVVGDEPEGGAGDQDGEQSDEEDATEVVPIPNSLTEQPESGRVVGDVGAPGGLPDSADGAASQGDNPGSSDLGESGKDLGAEATGKGS
jgi:hypothetical protein